MLPELAAEGVHDATSVGVVDTLPQVMVVKLLLELAVCGVQLVEPFGPMSVGVQVVVL